MVELIGLLIVAAVAWYVAAPLRAGWRDSHGDLDSDPRADLQMRRETLYREIADLDFDRRLGKVTEDDYRLERENYVSEAAAVLEELEQTQEQPPRRAAPMPPANQKLEEEIRRMRMERSEEDLGRLTRDVH